MSASRRSFFPVRFFRGLAAVFRGAGIIGRSRRLLAISAVPFVLCLLLYVGLLAAIIAFTDDVVDLIVEPGPWWRTALRWALFIALPVSFVVVAIFTYTGICLVVAAPLYEWLSTGVEKRVRGEVKEEPFTVGGMMMDFLRAGGYALLILGVEVAVLVAGLLFVPVTSVLAFMGSAALLALEYLDYPMERRRMTVRERLRFARRHIWELMGLGVPLLLAMMIPIVGAAAVPVGVAGGTLLFVEMRE